MKYQWEVTCCAELMGDTLKGTFNSIISKLYELSDLLLSEKGKSEEKYPKFTVKTGNCMSVLYDMHFSNNSEDKDYVGTINNRFVIYRDKNLTNNEIVIEYEDMAAKLTIEGLNV